MSSAKPPLRLLIASFPGSKAAAGLASDLYRQFMASDAPGLRIPVALLPERSDKLPAPLDLGAAEHTLLIALVDARMARRAEAADRVLADAWGRALVEARNQLQSDPSHGLVLAAVDARAFDLTPELAETSFVRLDRFSVGSPEQSADLAFQVAVSSLMLLRHQTVLGDPLDKAPIEVFVSHAKADIPAGKPAQSPAGPVQELLAWLAQGRVAGWYDAKRIESGQQFPKTIEAGVKRCDAFVCVLTDNWSNREWCRRELLLAKRQCKPIVVVDALESTVTRLFSYIGNARTMRWEPRRADAVGLAAVLEALRYEHTKLVLEQHKREGDLVLGTLPEALTIRPVPAGTRCILYPDPPLPREELAELLPIDVIGPAGAAPQTIELSTPLTRLTRWPRPPETDMVGLSLSGATDIRCWGASSEHLATFADDLATLLLLAGLRLAYGGVLDHGGASFDGVNFTTRLLGLVESYSPLALALGVERFHPIENFVAWPTHERFGDREVNQYGKWGRLVRGRVPNDLPLGELGADAKGWFDPQTELQRWAAARGTSSMRQQMNDATSARVAVGGKLADFSGAIPGVVEEILLARGIGANTAAAGAVQQRPKQIPVFLIGAFGGATRLVIEQLLPSPVREVPSHPTLMPEFEKHGQPFWTGATATAGLRELGRQGTAGLGNRLSEGENLELFYSTDVYRLVELILTGLGRCLGGMS